MLVVDTLNLRRFAVQAKMVMNEPMSESRHLFSYAALRIAE